jgi:hypothetical protein
MGWEDAATVHGRADRPPRSTAACLQLIGRPAGEIGVARDESTTLAHATPALTHLSVFLDDQFLHSNFHA